MQPVKVGLIGCGNISRTYLATMKSFATLDVAAWMPADPDVFGNA
jgi:predicted dehydrogenase